MTEPRATTGRVDDIAQAAARLFLDKGYDAASMADLAAATGLGKSSLYHHLASKDQLLAHICERPLAELQRELARAATLPEPAGVRLATALERFTHIVLADVPASHLIRSSRPTSTAGRHIADQCRRAEQMLVELVAAAQAEGAVRTDVDAALLTRLLVGTIDGLVVWYRPDTAQVRPESVRQAVLAVMQSGLRPEAAA